MNLTPAYPSKVSSVRHVCKPTKLLANPRGLTEAWLLVG